MRADTAAVMMYILVLWCPLVLLIFAISLKIYLQDRKKEREAKSYSSENVHQITTPSITSPAASPHREVEISRVHPRDERHQSAAPPHIPPAGWIPTPVMGLTQEEVTDKSNKGQLKNSEMMMELLKTRDPIEADVLKMVQAGATLADIKGRWGEEVADRAQEILTAAREELKAKIAPMLAAGMTREEIIEKLRKHADSSPTDSLDLDPETARIPHSPQGQPPPSAQTGKPSSRRSSRSSTKATSQSMSDPSPAPEGGRRPRTTYAVVRSVKLRKAAIEIHGKNCSACGFSFDETFGEILSQGYIEIHHLNSIAAGVRNTDPATDLAPLCGNCHAMADRLTRHHASPPRSICELKKLLFPASSLTDAETPRAVELSKSPVQVKIGKIREKKPKNRS